MSFPSSEMKCCFTITYTGKKSFILKTKFCFTPSTPENEDPKHYYLRIWGTKLHVFLYSVVECAKIKMLLYSSGSDHLWVARTDFPVLQVFSDYVFCYRQLLPLGSSVVAHWSVETLSCMVSQVLWTVAVWPLRWCGELFYLLLWLSF